MRFSIVSAWYLLVYPVSLQHAKRSARASGRETSHVRFVPVEYTVLVVWSMIRNVISDCFSSIYNIYAFGCVTVYGSMEYDR